MTRKTQTSAGAPWTRIILHADMDAFYAAVEQRDDPSLRGRPVVVGGDLKRGVVSTASYEARRYGLRSAMPMARAVRLCPEVVVLPPDFSRYKAVSKEINDVFHSYSPLVEPLSLDEAFIDMTGAEALFGAPEAMARKIKRDVFEITRGLTISVGASTTKYVAKVASDYQKPDGLTVVPPGEVTGFLWPLPVSRLWGVGEKSARRLRETGLETLGEVARADRVALVRVLGSLGEHVRRLANGDDPREVIPERDAKSIGKEVTLDEDLSGRPALMPHVRWCADRVARRLRLEGMVAAGVRVKIKTAGFRLLTRQGAARPPTDNAGEIIGVADRLLDQLDLDQPIRLVGLAAFNLEGDAGPVQRELFEDARHARGRKLDRAIDAVLDRFGDHAVKRGSE
jgi:DNA polymerase IV